MHAHFSAWHTCNLVRVPRVVRLAVFPEFVGHPLRSHGPVGQNELLATVNRLYLSHHPHVQPLCSLISVKLSLLKQLFTFSSIKGVEGVEFRNCWLHRQEVKMWHTSTVYSFLYQSPLQWSILGYFTLLTLKNESVVEITCPFPLHKRRGTPTGLWWHWFFCRCLSVTQLFTHSPRPLPGDPGLMKTSHDSDTSCCMRLCVAYVLSCTKVSTEKMNSMHFTPLWSQCTESEWSCHSRNFLLTSVD